MVHVYRRRRQRSKGNARLSKEPAHRTADKGSDADKVRALQGRVHVLTSGRGNRALQVSFERRLPVRVIRGYKLPSPYAPESGYRYDGLYVVTDMWEGKGVTGYRLLLLLLLLLLLSVCLSVSCVCVAKLLALCISATKSFAFALSACSISRRRRGARAGR